MNPLGKSTRLLLTAACLWVCFKVVELQGAIGTYQCLQTSKEDHGVTITIDTKNPTVRVGGGVGGCIALRDTSQDPHVLKIKYNLKAQTSSCQGQFFPDGSVAWTVSVYDSKDEVAEVLLVSCDESKTKVRTAISSTVITNKLGSSDLSEGTTAVRLEILSEQLVNKVVTPDNILELGWKAYFRVTLTYNASSLVLGISPHDVYVSPDSTFKTQVQMLDSRGCTTQIEGFRLDGPFRSIESGSSLTHVMISGKFVIRQFIGSRMLYFKMKFDTCDSENEARCILSCRAQGRRKREAEVRNDTWYYTNVFIEPYRGAYSTIYDEKEQCFTDVMFLVPNVVLAVLVCMATLTAVYLFLRLRRNKNNKVGSLPSKSGSQVTKSTVVS